MEKETNQNHETNDKLAHDEKINRKEALVKAGKYAAFTAVGMMVLLSPKQSQAQSLPGPGGDPWAH